MGVYIKGMEMPRNCEECDVKVVCKNYWKLIREQYTRPSWCPLVPVPPHGRLGDLDKLALEMMDAANADQALAMLDYAPTIIPAEPFNNLSKPFNEAEEGE